MRSCGNLLCQGHGLVNSTFYHHSDTFQASLPGIGGHRWSGLASSPLHLVPSHLNPVLPWPPSGYCFLSPRHLQAFIPQFCLLGLPILTFFPYLIPPYLFSPFLGNLPGKVFPDSSRVYHISCPSVLPQAPLMTHDSTSWTILPK